MPSLALPLVDETEFADVQFGGETKKITLSFKEQPTCSVPDGGDVWFTVSLWSGNNILCIKRLEFLREISNYGYLVAFYVESIKLPLYFLIIPLKCSNFNLTYLNTKDICSDAVKSVPLFVDQNDEEKTQKARDLKSITLKMSVSGCPTTRVRSPIRIMFFLLGVGTPEDRMTISDPFSIYKYIHEAVDIFLPVLASSFNGNYKKLESCLEIGKHDIDQLDSQGASALHVTSAFNHVDCLQLLLLNGADVNLTDKDNRNAVHKAAFHGSEESLRQLLAHKADINVKDKSSFTPLHIAVMRNKEKCLKVLLENEVDIMAGDKVGWTPLHHACNKNRIELCKLLLEQKADVMVKDHCSDTPLDIAISRGFPEISSLLFEAGGSVSDDHLLQFTSFHGYSECLQLLLDGGLDPNRVDGNSSSALHKAAQQGHVDCVTSLLGVLEDISGADVNGSTALHFACYYGHIRVISALLESGALLDVGDVHDATPLHNACYSGHVDAVTMLLARGVYAESIDANGKAPIHIAMERGFIQCAEVLFKYKVNIESKDSKQRTPLHYAVTSQESIQFLLERGADLEAIDKFGETPLMYAIRLSLSEIVRYLLSMGANIETANAVGVLPVHMASEKIKRVIEEESLLSDSKNEIRMIYEEVALRFNQKPRLGIEHLLASPLAERAVADITVIIEFLHKHGSHLNRTLVGEFISEPDSRSGDILMAFIEYLDFEDMEFDDALRTFLSKFRLPGEAQKIDRIMEKFAHHFYEQNEKTKIFPTEDQAYLLAFSLIMLNTDLHNPSIKNKMTCEQFVKNNTDTGLEHDLSPEFLGRMYHCILKREIKMENEDTAFGNSVAVKMGWMTKQGGRIKTWKRRWFILSDHVLYYFKEKQEETSKACGIVPLEDIIVREAEDKRKFCFEIAHSEDTAMKAMKRHQGQIQKGHHDSYLLCASNRQEMEEWMDAIARNGMDNQFKVLMEMKFMKVKKDQISGDIIQFSRLLSAIEVCQDVMDSKEGFKEKYPQGILESPYKNITCAIITHQQHRSHTLIVSGSKWKSLVDLKNQSKKKSNLPDSYSLLAIAKYVKRVLGKYIQKDFKVQVVGHCVGATIGLLTAQLLHDRGVRISSVVMFGMLRLLREDQCRALKEAKFPMVQVIHGKDHMCRLFPNYYSIGGALVLLKGAHYCWLEDPTHEEMEPSPSLDDLEEDHIYFHSMEAYNTLISEKVDLSVKVQYDLRSHYLK